jgi:hypothetical protein
VTVNSFWPRLLVHCPSRISAAPAAAMLDADTVLQRWITAVDLTGDLADRFGFWMAVPPETLPMGFVATKTL